MRSKERSLLLWLIDMVYLIVSTEDETAMPDKHTYLNKLESAIAEILGDLHYDEVQKFKTRARRKAYNTIVKYFAAPNVNNPEIKYGTIYQPEKVMLSIFHFMELLTAKEMLKISNESQFAEVVDFLIGTINEEYNTALANNDNDILKRISVRNEKCQKIAKKWWEEEIAA
jgi:hypothetical protein